MPPKDRHVRRFNKPLFELPESHPARRFLEAFIACRMRCVGRELEGIDQEWTRKRDGKRDSFSSFAYRVIAFDIELDNWLKMPPWFTEAERLCLDGIAESIADVRECRQAAVAAKNQAVVELCDDALHMFQLWIESIEYRRELLQKNLQGAVPRNRKLSPEQKSVEQKLIEPKSPNAWSKAGSWFTGVYRNAERRLRKRTAVSDAGGPGEVAPLGRELFLSERRHLRHMMKINHGVDWTGNPPVLYEDHSEPRRPVRGRVFNSDYMLCFKPNGDLPAEFRSCCARVLPRTMGAEIFLTIDVATKEPNRVHLLSGEAFQLKDFRPHADRLEAALEELGISLQLKRCQQTRMFVLAGEICFLIYPGGRTEELGSPQVLRSDTDAEIRAYFDGDNLICLDGWLRTEPEPDEDGWILESYQDE